MRMTARKASRARALGMMAEEPAVEWGEGAVNVGVEGC
jgi:hypothetical protein